MKPYYLLIVLLTVLSIPGHSGVTVKYSRANSTPSDSISSLPSMESMMESIETTMGFENVFEIISADVNNMEARLVHKHKKILYNPEFVNWINRCTGNKWAIIALIAHEMGHHLLGHTSSKLGSRPSTELEADEFAGYVLRRMGASLYQSQQVMLVIATPEASKTHPGRLDRMLAIKKGWENAY